MNEQEFAAAVRADPENLDLRLIAADWYEEQGDARAEFIRVQLALRNLTEHHEWYLDFSSREQTLLEQHRERWDAPLLQHLHAALDDLNRDPKQGNLRSWTYHGGFVEELQVDAQYLLARWETLVQIGPVRTLQVVNATPALLLQIARHPGWRQITGLRARSCALDDETMHAILDTTDLSRLEVLDLADNQLSSATADSLEVLHLPALKQLILTDNWLGADALASLQRRFGGVLQNENGVPAWVWLHEVDGERDPDIIGESYDDGALYENGRKVQEDEETSVDRFNGQTEFEELPWERPPAYSGFESEATVTAEERTRFDEDDVNPEVDADFHDDDERARYLRELYEGDDPWDDDLV